MMGKGGKMLGISELHASVSFTKSHHWRTAYALPILPPVLTHARPGLLEHVQTETDQFQDSCPLLHSLAD